MVKQMLLVFFGGGIGCTLRYLVGKINLIQKEAFPFATLAVNLIGCLLIGILMGWSLKNQPLQNNLVLFLVTGFCGGFTTFSAFSLENLTLLKEGHTFLFLTYVFVSIFIGLLLTFLGFYITKSH